MWDQVDWCSVEASSGTVFIGWHLILHKSCWNSLLYLTVLFQLVWGSKWSSDMERILYPTPEGSVASKEKGDRFHTELQEQCSGPWVYSGSKNTLGLKSLHLWCFFAVILKLCSSSDSRNAKPRLWVWVQFMHASTPTLKFSLSYSRFLSNVLEVRHPIWNAFLFFSDWNEIGDSRWDFNCF